MTTIAQAFEEFLENLKPTSYQKDILIPARQGSVAKNLNEKFPSSSNMPLHRVALIGSAAKRTIIRPVDDIDVLAVFSNEEQAWNKYRNDSQGFLYRIREAYSDTITQQVGARGQAIRIFFKIGGHVDIAPVFHSSGDDYLLPSGDNSWIYTSPFKANSWFTERNIALGK